METSDLKLPCNHLVTDIKLMLGQPYTLNQCRICWLYVNDITYRELFTKHVIQPGTITTKPPSVMQRVEAFAKAMMIETNWRTGGGAPPTEEEKTTRRKLCDTCSARDPINDTCTICGCYLEAGLLPPRPLGKIGCSTQACPKKLWSFTGGYVPKQGTGCGSN